MGNVFRAGADNLYLSNGGTEVFVEVLTLAVAELAAEPWELRFGALLAAQDQRVMGRGAVGFDLTELDWGATAAERAAARGFLLRVIDLAAGRHRWDELGYDPPYVSDHLLRFRRMVEAFEPPATAPPGEALPAPAVASCAAHRVLSGLPLWEGCVFCHR
ncbi:hypothetical protein [Streptomyces sp. A012304]|uniref:hypothetical protein n=1 Tax=Streptomyces sp. A012304 TaxID=375446 RepID=UPI0022316CDF|nr:hypothetical protein [Streptomyces sp. A012304]GKQ34848.1 hypothetical protein ALMP_13970 [Streptomyces sp. A012304]